MPLSDKTLAEMTAGAAALAEQRGSPLPPGYMDAIVRTHERAALLRRWEQSGKVEIEITSAATQYSPYKKIETSRVYRVCKGGPTFEDKEAEQAGASPSEVLIAHLALALQAIGEA